VRRALALAAALLLFAGTASAQTPPKIGVVFMHGKQGGALEPQLEGMSAALRAAGYLVDMPEMCWSGTRIYDKPFLDCLADADAAASRLKAQGATSIVIMGHSLGGMAAIAYGARRDGLKAVVALAPGPDNKFLLMKQPQVAASLMQAQQLVAQGKGDVPASFTDFNTNRFGSQPFQVHTTANIFVSFLSADGPAEIETNVRQVKAPLLIVSGTRDPSQGGAAMLFAQAPPNPLSKRAVVDADHMGTPQAAIDTVIGWLAALGRP